jgi:serine phosphatase RsbU (regulator of sigma subunit)
LKEKPEFTNHIIQYQPNDVYYLFSDGITDQFGGLEGKKYMSKRFKNELLTTSQFNVATQKEIILNNFNNWTKAPDLPQKYEQVDDVCVIGFKI